MFSKCCFGTPWHVIGLANFVESNGSFVSIYIYISPWGTMCGYRGFCCKQSACSGFTGGRVYLDSLWKLVSIPHSLVSSIAVGGTKCCHLHCIKDVEGLVSWRSGPCQSCQISTPYILTPKAGLGNPMSPLHLGSPRRSACICKEEISSWSCSKGSCTSICKRGRVWTKYLKCLILKCHIYTYRFETPW